MSGPSSPARATLYTDGRGILRIALDDTESQPVLPVTDLRFYEPDFRTLRQQSIHAVAERMRRGTPALLSVGLARPWQRPGDTAPRHWLQVNNIHLQDDPTWQG